MRSLRLVAAGLVVALSGAALATTLDARGWQAGTPAAGAARVMGPISDTPIVLDLPAAVARRIKGPTLLVYFSPGCVHCQAVAPELARLAKRLEGRLTVLGVAASSGAPEDVALFRKAFDWTFEVVRDDDRTIAAAMGARATPSAALVERVAGDVVVRDVWYPYAKGSDVLVEMRLQANPFAAFTEDRYVGQRTCAACHTTEAESWAVTHHAVAWRTLQTSDKTGDAACVGCHVTGHGKPGGWDGTPATDALVDVGCEACHGPGGPHDGKRAVASSSCEGCHDAKHSIAFSYAKGLPLIDHYRSSAMDDEAFREARRALWEGEAPRELLAFDAGVYVGAEACATCHAGPHAQWAASKHGQAMKPLVTGGTDGSVTCVRCHATPTQVGPPATELTGYRTSEGVGCESCHGPGQAHVQAKGGTDNIVGLGESCPVCVIEAVCTSCHTREWDPDWNLEAGLSTIRHTPVESSEP